MSAHSLQPVPDTAPASSAPTQWAAAITFGLLLVALGVGFTRARKQLERAEVDLALEADFERLERSVEAHPSLPRGEH
ncbi:MAG: hypothetical protein QM756_38925 [Polyangiaceae bacterium]